MSNLYPQELSVFSQLFNGCKSFGCPNLGESETARYSRSDRLGYPALHCPLCGSYPPVLENEPIGQLIKQNYQQHLQQKLAACPQCKPNFLYKSSAISKVLSYGVTPAGTQRRKCASCGKIFSLLNTEQMTRKLQHLFDLLVSGEKPQDLIKCSQMHSKKFYQSLGQLSALLRHFSRIQEQCRLSVARNVTLMTHSQVVRCRAGVTGSHGVDLWFLSTTDAKTGYQFLQTSNLLLGDQQTKGVYNPNALEQEIEVIPENLLKTAEKNYHKIMSRRQFDELFYCSESRSKTKEGALLRPVYGAHCHFQLLQAMFNPVKKLSIILEHESFLRGSCIWAFSEQVKTGNCQLYYLYHAACNKEVHTSTSDEAKQRILGWWNERWVQQAYSWHKLHWNIALGYLTKPIKNNPILTRPDWNHDFWQQYIEWLPVTYHRKIKCETMVQWLEIFRFIYNYLKAESRTEGLDIKDTELTSINSLVSYVNR
ncbi:hypothetical protein [Photobacterium sp.]|uniref:hypothetical protein n=1 Tax=Photobacterium sp. TaxID=660 RepID=UPI00299CDA3D|nr:hypothetical protein [Photobacterium sp.]MDX1302297.1 hypothetical protein [Photobacterium sp.]